MHIPFPPKDRYEFDNLDYLAKNSVEAPQTNTRVQTDTITLNCTSNVLSGQTVAYTKPFKKGTSPVLFLFVNPSTTSSKVTPSYTLASETGFTAQCYSDTTQQVTISYIAIGQV